MSSDYAGKKSKAIESLLGPEHEMVMHALIPYQIGGTLDLSYYPNGIPGTGVATQELIGEDGKENVTRNQMPYELVMFTRVPLDLEKANDPAGDFGKVHRSINSALNLVARYGSQTALNPGDTFEYPSDVPMDDRRFFLFDEYAPEGKKLVIDGKECLLLLVMEIHRSELLFARQHRTARLVESLKAAGAYPYSDMDRPVVGDVSVLVALDLWDALPIGLGPLVPSYLQRHLASRAPDHLLARRPDGDIDVDKAPGMVFFPLQGDEANETARADFLRMINEQLPNSPEVLQSLSPTEIVTRLCSMYQAVTGTDNYSRVCLSWCVAKKLVPAAGQPPALTPISPTARQQNSYTGPCTANPVRPVKYGIYADLLAGSIACLLGITAVMINRIHIPRLIGIALSATMLLLFAGACAYVLLVLHRAWRMLPQAAARTSPGKAVGFLFIPFFNLYWVFQAVYGWSKDYNKSLASGHHEAPRASEGLFLALCILQVLVLLPLCGILSALAVAVVIQPMVTWQMCRSINHFASSRASAV